MSFIEIQGLPTLPKPPQKPEGFPLFRLGFRVFFFAGALWSLLTILLWMLMYTGVINFPHHFSAMQWHAREMIFGFVGAVIAGFLLTAAGNWTGLPMPSGRRLQLLAGLWLAARLLPFFSFLPAAVAGIVDVAFFMSVAVLLSLSLHKTKQFRNLPFPLLLVGLALADAVSVWGYRNLHGVAVGTEMAMYLCLTMVILMGGRVIPGFTKGKIPQALTQSYPVVEKLAVLSFLIAAVSDLISLPGGWCGMIFLIAAGIHFVRLAGWFTPEVFKQPLLWILYAAYFWLAFGLLLKGLAGFAIVNPMLARHALTAGALGSICLGMMTRVTLGHTGRPLVLSRLTITAFLLMQGVAVFRVLIPLLIPSFYLRGIHISTLCWFLAFGIYLLIYGPMLFKPRADGGRG